MNLHGKGNLTHLAFLNMTSLGPSVRMAGSSTPARVQIAQIPHIIRIVRRTGKRLKILNLLYPLLQLGIGIQAFSRY